MAGKGEGKKQDSDNAEQTYIRVSKPEFSFVEKLAFTLSI